MFAALMLSMFMFMNVGAAALDVADETTEAVVDETTEAVVEETTEAAMLDAVDLAAYRKDGTIRIEEEKFVENFIRRFAESADLSNTYKIEIFDINTKPPKVSLRVSSTKETTATGEVMDFDIVNNIDAILETKY